MKDRPILFSAPMVRAIIDGRKTQTRRIVKFPKWMDESDYNEAILAMNRSESKMIGDRGRCDGYRYLWKCPYGQPGDRLWVRETAFIHNPPNEREPNGTVYYAADIGLGGPGSRPTPSIYMPRWASRINLDIVNVRVERLQDISPKDCESEGCSGGHDSIPGYRYNALPKEHYRWLWESINGPGSWYANPFVWVVEFKMVI